MIISRHFTKAAIAAAKAFHAKVILACIFCAGNTNVARWLIANAANEYLGFGHLLLLRTGRVGGGCDSGASFRASSVRQRWASALITLYSFSRVAASSTLCCRSTSRWRELSA